MDIRRCKPELETRVLTIPEFDETYVVAQESIADSLRRLHNRALLYLIDGAVGTHWTSVSLSYQPNGILRGMTVLDGEEQVPPHPASPLMRHAVRKHTEYVYLPNNVIQGVDVQGELERLFRQWDDEEPCGELEPLVDHAWGQLINALPPLGITGQRRTMMTRDELVRIVKGDGDAQSAQDHRSPGYFSQDGSPTLG
jgi:hypothetical protein